jgi:hypothetical protein
VSKGDLLVERGAERLRELADKAARRGDHVGEWLSAELRNDADFLRKLKPSLIATRAKGNHAPSADGRPSAAPPPTPEQAEQPKQPAEASAHADAPVAPAATPRKPKRKKPGRGGVPPIAVVGAALVAGIVIAKIVDWRGHAHPRD